MARDRELALSIAAVGVGFQTLPSSDTKVPSSYWYKVMTSGLIRVGIRSCSWALKIARAAYDVKTLSALHVAKACVALLLDFLKSLDSSNNGALAFR